MICLGLGLFSSFVSSVSSYYLKICLLQFWEISLNYFIDNSFSFISLFLLFRVLIWALDLLVWFSNFLIFSPFIFVLLSSKFLKVCLLTLQFFISVTLFLRRCKTVSRCFLLAAVPLVVSLLQHLQLALRGNFMKFSFCWTYLIIIFSYMIALYLVKE